MTDTTSRAVCPNRISMNCIIRPIPIDVRQYQYLNGFPSSDRE
jgi:hypothetical protein